MIEARPNIGHSREGCAIALYRARTWVYADRDPGGSHGTQNPPSIRLLLAAAMAIATAPVTAQAAAPQDSTLAAVQTVTMKLKKSWRVKKPKQLKVKDGAMSCRVARLKRKKKKPATAVVLRCTLPAGPLRERPSRSPSS
ncbi:MAG: hypothetical protein IPG68_03910 [Micrococcales bacterium]|nr:hypothetical protein [Micrococcales bacterium]